MWAVIGLGNPGRRYAGTRHNVGFSFIKTLAREWKAELRTRRYAAKIAEVKRNGERLVLALPQTYMNQSGLAVRQLMEGLKMNPEKMVIVYDDLDIPLGEIRVRKAGSAGTHKGMKSIVHEIGATSFPRIRVGIGPLRNRADAVSYVLAPFSADEVPGLKKGLARAREALVMILDGCLDAAMNTFNQKSRRQDQSERGKIESR